MNILLVVTSHARLGETGYRTGVWLDGLAASYYVFVDAGAEVTLASPLGGQAPLDPRSDAPGNPSAAVQRFRQDADARALLADTLRLDQVFASDFAGACFCGGYGAMWDLAESTGAARLVGELHRAGKPVASICHGAAALRRAVAADGTPLVRGRAVTGTPNSELETLGLLHVLPFSLQDELIALGGRYGKGPDDAPHVVQDGLLITGQNAASAASASRALLDELAVRRAAPIAMSR